MCFSCAKGSFLDPNLRVCRPWQSPCLSRSSSFCQRRELWKGGPVWPGRAVKACCVTASAAHPACRVFLSSGRFARAPPHPTSPRPQPQGRAAGILITDTNKDRKWPAGRPIGRRPRPGWRRGRPACSGARAQALVALGRGKTADVSVVAVLGGTRPRGVAGPGARGMGGGRRPPQLSVEPAGRVGRLRASQGVFICEPPVGPPRQTWASSLGLLKLVDYSVHGEIRLSHSHHLP